MLNKCWNIKKKNMAKERKKAYEESLNVQQMRNEVFKWFQYTRPNIFRNRENVEAMCDERLNQLKLLNNAFTIFHTFSRWDDRLNSFNI